MRRASVEALRALIEGFDPNEPRDAHGRWNARGVPDNWEKWTEETEMVSIEELKKYLQVDRSREHDYNAKLADSIQERGFKEPLYLTFHKQEGTVTLGEGHHRLIAAEKLGETHVPVRVVRNDRDYNKGDPHYTPSPPSPKIPEKVRADMRPSELGIGGLSREAYEAHKAQHAELPPEMAALDKAGKIHGEWRKLTPKERATVVEALAQKREGKLDPEGSLRLHARVILDRLAKAAKG